jgi:hypothetical protein
VTDKFFVETLPADTFGVIEQLQQSDPAFLKSFYLSGGTALSLQLSHRESEDLDFFNQNSFDPRQVEQQLTSFANLSQTELAEGTLNTFMNGVKLQFLEYPYPLIEPKIKWHNIYLSSVLDMPFNSLV